MKYAKIIGPVFDEKTNRKLKDFCLKNNVSQSEVLRVLVERSPIKIDVKSKSEISRAARKGLINNMSTRFFLIKKTLDKLEKMCKKNNASYSEVTRRLVDFADLENIPFKTSVEKRAEAKGKILTDIYVYRRLAYGIKLDTTLDETTNGKIRDFALANSTTPSEILRVLVERSPIKIDVKNRGEISKETYNGNPHNIANHFYLPEELIKKIEKMRIENRTSYSEIVRRIIETADFKKIKFRTINEIFPILLKSKSKKKSQKAKKKLVRINAFLHNTTHKKLKNFVTKNNLSISEVLKVLADNVDTKTSQEKYNLFFYTGKKNVGKNVNKFNVTEDTCNKLRKIHLISQKTFSEIIDKLISTTVLDTRFF